MFFDYLNKYLTFEILLYFWFFLGENNWNTTMHIILNKALRENIVEYFFYR